MWQVFKFTNNQELGRLEAWVTERNAKVDLPRLNWVKTGTVLRMTRMGRCPPLHTPTLPTMPQTEHIKGEVRCHRAGPALSSVYLTVTIPPASVIKGPFCQVVCTQDSPTEPSTWPVSDGSKEPQTKFYMHPEQSHPYFHVFAYFL